MSHLVTHHSIKENGERIYETMLKSNKTVLQMDVRESGLGVECELMIAEMCQKNLNLLDNHK